MGTVEDHQYMQYFNPGARAPHWEPIKSANEKLIDAINGLRCVIEEIRDAMKGSTGPIVTGIQALTEYRRLVDES